MTAGPIAQDPPGRAAGGGGPRPRLGGEEFFWGAAALSINLAGGGREAPLPPIKGSYRVDSSIPSAGGSGGSRPALPLACGFANQPSNGYTRPRRGRAEEGGPRRRSWTRLPLAFGRVSSGPQPARTPGLRRFGSSSCRWRCLTPGLARLPPPGLASPAFGVGFACVGTPFTPPARLPAPPPHRFPPGWGGWFRLRGSTVEPATSLDSTPYP